MELRGGSRKANECVVLLDRLNSYEGEMVAPYDPTLQLDCSPMTPVVIGGTQYIRDFSGYGRNGTPTGFAGTDVEYEDAPGGQCISISTPKYVNHGNILDYTFQDFSLEFIINTNSLANVPCLANKGTANINGYSCFLQGDGRISIVTSQAAANQATHSAVGTIAVTQWNHILFARSGATYRIYKNGIETAYSVVGVHINPVTSANDFYTGHYIAGAGNDLNGRILRYRSWNRALGAAEIYERYIASGRGV